MRILIVDDERQITRVLRTSLQSSGYEVSVATNGLEAFDLIQKLDPALAFLDIQMPGLDGLGVVRRLKDGGIDVAPFKVN